MPVPGDPILSSSLCGHQTCMRCTAVLVDKILIHNSSFLNYTLLEFPARPGGLGLWSQHSGGCISSKPARDLEWVQGQGRWDLVKNKDLNKPFLTFIHLLPVCGWAFVCVHTCHSTHGQIKGQFTGACFLLPSCVSRIKSSHRTWWQVTLSTEASCQPKLSHLVFILREDLIL